MTRFCPNCDDIREVISKRQLETYHVRGEAIDVEAEVLVCTTCGSPVFDPETDERNLQAAYRIYRQRHGLLTPEEIRSLRERYGLSQRSLARLLGWGLVTIQRYEQGALQERAHDQILRQLEDPYTVLQWLNTYGDRLPDHIRTRVRDQVLTAANAAQPERLAREVEQMIAIDCENRPDLHGFRRFNLDRFGDLVAFIAANSPGAFKTKVAKLLWLCDFAHFRRYRVSISGLAYARLPYGPAPDHFQSLLGALEELGSIKLKEEWAGPYVGEVVSPTLEVDIQDFTEAELDTIRRVLQRFGRLQATELSRLSHDESAWTDRRDGDLIPYTEADHLRMLESL